MYCTTSVQGQSLKADSLVALSRSFPDDTLKIDLLVQASTIYRRITPDSAVKYAALALDLSNRLALKQFQARSKNMLAAAYYMKGSFEEAASFWEASLLDYQETGDSLRAAVIIGNIGLVNERQGNYLDALRYHKQSVALKEKHGSNSEQLAVSFNNIGIIYELIGDYPLSIEYHQRALKIHQELNMKSRISTSLYNLARVYKRQHNVELAKSYFKKSLAEKRKVEDQWGMVLCKNALGELFLDEGEMDSSLYYFQLNYDLAKKINAQNELRAASISLARWHYENGDEQQAITWSERALENEATSEISGQQKELYEVMHKSFKELGRFQEAYKYLELTKNIADSLASAEVIRKMGFMEAQYNFEKQQLAEQEEQLKKEYELQQRIEKQENEKLAIFIVLVLILVGILVTYRSYETLRSKNELLLRQKEEIEFLKENLEELVEERTRELKQKSEQISQYAFNNAHNLRGPLSRLIALVDSIKLGHFDQEEDKDFVVSSLEKSTREMDEVVRLINKELGQ